MSVIDRPTVIPDKGCERRIVLHGVSWHFYDSFLKELGDHASVRLAFDQGDLEIMAPSSNHEFYKSRIRRVVETLARRLDIDHLNCGSFTCRKEDLERGLEPDESYYFQSLSLLHDLFNIDLSIDPAPDLAIEVDVTQSSLDQLGIYAALRVGEVWIYDGRGLTIHLLHDASSYIVSDRSRIFPMVPINELLPFIDPANAITDLKWNKSFESWIDSRIADWIR